MSGDDIQENNLNSCWVTIICVISQAYLEKCFLQLVNLTMVEHIKIKLRKNIDAIL